ncbi:F-box/FBD/LRR-repeat protein-like protein [Tanacetum coccineum]
MRYVRGTIDHGLQLHVSYTAELTAYNDVDWVGCPVTRRSTLDRYVPTKEQKKHVLSALEKVKAAMKRAHGTYKASKAATEDGINNMPENVISHILDCLPIKDAVRTSILSRNWRFKWTNISQLIFDEKFIKPRSDGENNYKERTISRLLLHLKGVITKFVLCVPHYKILDFEDVNHWVMFLSQKGVREFTLKNGHIKTLKLPSHLYACLDLKLLKLVNCCFHTPPNFCGFPDLLKLKLHLVGFESGNIGEFISCCPLLEILKISYNHPSSKVKLDEITKLKNLKVLSLLLHICDLGIIGIKSSDIFELVGIFPKLQELYLDFQKFELADGRKLGRTVFPCLKTLKLYSIDFGSSTMLSCAFDLLPNFNESQAALTQNENLGSHTSSLAGARVQWKFQFPLHSCSLAGSTSAMNVSNWGGHLHFHEVGECDG